MKALTFQVMMEVVMGFEMWADPAVGHKLTEAWRVFTAGVFSLPLRWAAAARSGWLRHALGGRDAERGLQEPAQQPVWWSAAAPAKYKAAQPAAE